MSAENQIYQTTVIDKILDNIDDPRDIVSLCLVNKRLMKICKESPLVMHKTIDLLQNLEHDDVNILISEYPILYKIIKKYLKLSKEDEIMIYDYINHIDIHTEMYPEKDFIRLIDNVKKMKYPEARQRYINGITHLIHQLYECTIYKNLMNKYYNKGTPSNELYQMANASSEHLEELLRLRAYPLSFISFIS